MCKYCRCEDLVKNGFVRNKQRYRCVKCGKNQVAGDLRVKYANAIRKQALAMYLNSSGLRSIGRVLGVPFQLVSRWVADAGRIVEEEIMKLRMNPRHVSILEMGRAIHLRSKKQQQVRVWLAVDRDRNEVIAAHIGGGAWEDARQLYWQIHRRTIDLIATDGNYSYETMFPVYQQHVVTKAETCLVEAKTSSLRDMLARLNRRTKRYSKSLDMLRYSVWLWMRKDFALSADQRARVPHQRWP